MYDSTSKHVIAAACNTASPVEDENDDEDECELLPPISRRATSI
jgi:hypothetical protein